MRALREIRTSKPSNPAMH